MSKRALPFHLTCRSKFSSQFVLLAAEIVVENHAVIADPEDRSNMRTKFSKHSCNLSNSNQLFSSNSLLPNPKLPISSNNSPCHNHKTPMTIIAKMIRATQTKKSVSMLFSSPNSNFRCLSLHHSNNKLNPRFHSSPSRWCNNNPTTTIIADIIATTTSSSNSLMLCIRPSQPDLTEEVVEGDIAEQHIADHAEHIRSTNSLYSLSLNKPLASRIPPCINLQLWWVKWLERLMEFLLRPLRQLLKLQDRAEEQEGEAEELTALAEVTTIRTHSTLTLRLSRRSQRPLKRLRNSRRKNLPRLALSMLKILRAIFPKKVKFQAKTRSTIH